MKTKTWQSLKYFVQCLPQIVWVTLRESTPCLMVKRDANPPRKEGTGKLLFYCSSCFVAKTRLSTDINLPFYHFGVLQFFLFANLIDHLIGFESLPA